MLETGETIKDQIQTLLSGKERVEIPLTPVQLQALREEMGPNDFGLREADDAIVVLLQMEARKYKIGSGFSLLRRRRRFSFPQTISLEVKAGFQSSVLRVERNSGLELKDGREPEMRYLPILTTLEGGNAGVQIMKCSQPVRKATREELQACGKLLAFLCEANLIGQNTASVST